MVFRYYRIESPNDLPTLKELLKNPARVDVADGMPRWYFGKRRLLFSGWMGNAFVIQCSTALDPLTSRVVGALRESQEGTVLELRVPEGVAPVIPYLFAAILGIGLFGTIVIAKLTAGSPPDPSGFVQDTVWLAMILAAWVGACIAAPLLAREGRARTLQFIADAIGVPHSSWQLLRDRPESLSPLVCRGLRSFG